MWKKIEKIFSKNYLLISVLSLAGFIRLYRINEFLGFWYDQGRDALVIWDLIHKGKLFLIGPMMANTGFFRGPWYYWLITPFYWLGQGNPVWPMVFLIVTTVIAIYFVYKLGGLFPAFLAAISMYLVGASRWLSDPTPSLLASVLLVWATYKFLQKKIWALPLIGLLVGLSLNFTAAAEVFFIPALLVIFYIKRKNLPNIKIIFLSIALFLFTFLPQVIFELRHPGVQTGAFYQFLFNKNSFTLSFWQIVVDRAEFYYNLFASKFWLNGGMIFAPFFIYFVFLIFRRWKEFWKDDKFKILFLFSVAPIVGTLFFTGSEGNIYEYYFTAYYLIWILLFTKVVTAKLVLIPFVLVSITMNTIFYTDNYFKSALDPATITFTSQTMAIDWIYNDSKGKEFNVDVYVPPVVPYAYQYLFQWMGDTKYNRLPNENNVTLLYTLHEIDPDHPKLIGAWLDRQNNIGKIEETAVFGGITIERRERLYEK